MRRALPIVAVSAFFALLPWLLAAPAPDPGRPSGWRHSRAVPGTDGTRALAADFASLRPGGVLVVGPGTYTVSKPLVAAADATVIWQDVRLRAKVPGAPVITLVNQAKFSGRLTIACG